MKRIVWNNIWLVLNLLVGIWNIVMGCINDNVLNIIVACFNLFISGGLAVSLITHISEKVMSGEKDESL